MANQISTAHLSIARQNFAECQTMFVALGDESRQQIIMALIGTTCETGLRVGEITKAVNLSRPAVSHHLKILRDAGLINQRKDGTMNFYSVDIRSNFSKLTNLIKIIEKLQAETYG